MLLAWLVGEKHHTSWELVRTAASQSAPDLLNQDLYLKNAQVIHMHVEVGELLG